MIMNCKTVKSVMSEFVDERLAAADAWQVQTHLSECAECARLRRDFGALRQSLQALPVRQPSANFDAALAQRLALTRRPAPRPTWRDRVRLLLPRPAPLLRPALAFGVAMAAVGGVLFLPTHSPLPDPSVTVAAHTADHAFVAACVAQRRRDAAGEPLADLAAQNLAGNLDSPALDGPAPGEPSPAPAPDSEVF